MPAHRTVVTAQMFRRRDGRLLSAASAVAGAWLGGYAGDRLGVAITDRRGQRGLDGILLESVAAVAGFLTGLWLLVVVALAVANRSRPILTATLAAALGAVGLVAVVLLGWALDALMSPDSRPGWYDGAAAVLLTVVTATAGYAGRCFAVRPPQPSPHPAR